MERSKLLQFGIGIAILVALIFGVRHMAAPKLPPMDFSLTQPTRDGLFRVGLEPEPGALTVGGIHAWTISVTMPGGQPVTGATIVIDGGMPAHGHGLPTAPEVTSELGNGRYRLEGVKFSMDGLWVLDFAVTAAGKSDAARFNLRI